MVPAESLRRPTAKIDPREKRDFKVSVCCYIDIYIYIFFSPFVFKVWSSDSDTTHNPPTDLVMKGKRWFVSGDMTTALINADDEVSLETCFLDKATS